MKRRSFLALGAAAAVVPVLPPLSVEADIVGFGLAPLKTEGTVMMDLSEASLEQAMLAILAQGDVRLALHPTAIVRGDWTDA